MTDQAGSIQGRDRHKGSSRASQPRRNAGDRGLANDLGRPTAVDGAWPRRPGGAAGCPLHADAQPAYATFAYRDLCAGRREVRVPSWRRIGGSGTPSCSNSTACATLITFGHQRHMSDLFGVSGRRLLKELDMPEPWRSHVDASLGTRLTISRAGSCRRPD